MKARLSLLLLTILIVSFIAVYFDITVDLFEDGSFKLAGCLPWAICN